MFNFSPIRKRLLAALESEIVKAENAFKATKEALETKFFADVSDLQGKLEADTEAAAVEQVKASVRSLLT